MLGAAAGGTPPDPGWPDRLMDTLEVLREHILKEQDGLFPAALTSLGGADWDTVDAVRDSDVVITMGCGDTCPIFPGKRYEDWDLTDPAGRPIEVVRQVRDDIRDRVQSLIAEMIPAQH